MTIWTEGSMSRQSYLPSPTNQRWQYDTRSIFQLFNDKGRQVLLFLLPSFFSQYYSKQTVKPSKFSETSFLNGVKGIVACIVFLENFSRPWQKGLYHGYGEEDNQSWLQLPIIRALYAGPSVAVFFAISGYVISYKPLLFIKNRSFEKLGLVMHSSIFKRGPRLFIPPLISSLFLAIAARYGLLRIPSHDVVGYAPKLPPAFASLPEQIEDYARFAREELTNLWNLEKRESSYDANLWTVPVQFVASMGIFIILLGTAQLRPAFRNSFVIILFVYWMIQGHWEIATFLGGMFLADRDIQRLAELHHKEEDLTSENPTRPTKNLVKNAFTTYCLLIALYLGSFPQISADKTPGFITLSQLSEDDNNWKTYSALLLLYTLSRSASLQKIFLLPATQYLGKISYAIYLVHGPILLTFGYSFVPYAWRYTDNSTSLQYQSGFALALLALIPVVVCIADLWRRVIEMPCVRLVEWFQEQFFVGIK